MSLQPPRIRRLGKIAGLNIYLVSGEYVRNNTDLDFTCGGQEAVYPSYVPPGEVWLDDVLGPLDANATILHEIVERDQMMRFGKNYDDGHEVASATERPFRHQMLKQRTKKIDLPLVAAAYRAYLKNPGKYLYVPRPDEPKKSPRVLDQEIRQMLKLR